MVTLWIPSGLPHQPKTKKLKRPRSVTEKYQKKSPAAHPIESPTVIEAKQTEEELRLQAELWEQQRERYEAMEARRKKDEIERRKRIEAEDLAIAERMTPVAPVFVTT